MIFCVEDDNGIRELIIYTLTAAGFKAKGFADPAAFWEGLRECRPQLVLLDIMLPEEDGLTILRKLRSQSEYANIPVIMATARGTEYDKVLGLDMGADDYLAKPFGMMEMLSRVKAVLRRTEPGKQDRISVGAIVVERMQHRVYVSGEEIILTLKEYELLVLLCENPGIVFTRDKLLERVWGLNYLGETRTVDVHVGTLRTKLGQAGSMIETVRGVGYRMEKKL